MLLLKLVFVVVLATHIVFSCDQSMFYSSGVPKLLLLLLLLLILVLFVLLVVVVLIVVPIFTLCLVVVMLK